MVVLDTNHLRHFGGRSNVAQALQTRLKNSGPDLATTVVCVEEILEGWLIEIRRQAAQPHQQISAYREFSRQVDVLARWTVLPWDAESADLFIKFRRNGIRIGSMDLKIACIAISHDALLLTQNTVDFAKVPGLRHEDWLR